FIGEFVKNTLMYLLFKRHCKLIYDYRIWSSNLLLIFSGIVVFGLVSHLDDSFVYWLGLSVLFGVSYVFYLINFHALTKVELEKLRSVIMASNKTSVVYQKLEPLLHLLTIRKKN
ncbi:MAG: hypothetical protein N4A74_19360, partial [Carboxylicivirga sp.]|nr:hypothetical protein [Carboxylicivirga sp.]